jgi:hypothetical protein
VAGEEGGAIMNMPEYTPPNLGLVSEAPRGPITLAIFDNITGWRFLQSTKKEALRVGIAHFYVLCAG